MQTTADTTQQGCGFPHQSGRSSTAHEHAWLPLVSASLRKKTRHQLVKVWKGRHIPRLERATLASASHENRAATDTRHPEATWSTRSRSFHRKREGILEVGGSPAAQCGATRALSAHVTSAHAACWLLLSPRLPAPLGDEAPPPGWPEASEKHRLTA